jgi:hypothetical protein
MGKIKGRPKPYLTWLGAVRWTPFIGRGIIIVKYWFSVNDEEQERRFRDRMMLTSVLLAALLGRSRSPDTACPRP